MLTSLAKCGGRKSARSVSSKVGGVVRRREGRADSDYDHHSQHQSLVSIHDEEFVYKEGEKDHEKPLSLIHKNVGNQVKQQTEEGVSYSYSNAKTFDFLKEKTDKLFKNSSIADWTAQQLVTEWLRLLPTLSLRKQRDAIRLADIAARDMIQGPPDGAFAQRTLELIRAWTRVGDAERANSLLDCLVEGYGHAEEPSVVHDIALAYCSVITAWGNDNGGEDSVARALALFQKMDYRPVEAYNGVLNVHGNRGQAMEATKFFRDMQANATVRPDAISFGTLMKAWSRSGNLDAQKHIDNLFEELKETHQAEGCPLDLMPNEITFAIAMTLAPPERATALLQEMCAMYEASRNPRVAPHVRHYMLAMRSWAKTGNPHEAERLLEELTSAYYRGGNEKLRPGHEVSMYQNVQCACIRIFQKGSSGSLLTQMCCNTYNIMSSVL